MGTLFGTKILNKIAIRQMATLKSVRLQELSAKHGFHFLGFLNLEASFEEDLQRLGDWQEHGYAGDLHYMKKNPGQFTDFSRLLSSTQTVLSFAVPYSPRPRQELLPGHARVARYALGRDYHRVIPKKLKVLMAEIAKEEPDLEYRIFSDAVPLLERAVARKAGLGFVGKNSILIRPRLGSYFFLCEVLINRRIEEEFTLKIYKENCGRCVRCRNDCPTTALIDDYILDSNKCISYLTIEKRGVLSRRERGMLDSWIFGCDICQECCPFNHAPAKKGDLNVFEEFINNRLSGGQIDLNFVFSLTDDQQFLKAFAGTPIMRARREGLLRNACCVATLQGYGQFIQKIERLIELDQSAVIRTHALSALMQLQESAAKKRSYLENLEKDRNEQVLEEVRFWQVNHL